MKGIPALGGISNEVGIVSKLSGIPNLTFVSLSIFTGLGIAPWSTDLTFFPNPYD